MCAWLVVGPRLRVTAESEEIVRLDRELRDTHARLQLMQTYVRPASPHPVRPSACMPIMRPPEGRKPCRLLSLTGCGGCCLVVAMVSRYDHLEAKTKAQSEIQQGSIDQLEEYNERIRDLRRALQASTRTPPTHPHACMNRPSFRPLTMSSRGDGGGCAVGGEQDAQREKEELELQASQVSDLEERNRELKQLNDHLEQQITKLCESPFISEAFQKQERWVNG